MKSLTRVKKIIEEINKEARKIRRKIRIMNVCGTHEETITKAGIRSIFPENINLFPGPGCPVCVTPEKEIIDVIDLSEERDVIITTYGDMYKVPTKIGSLEYVKSTGKDIRIVYSPIESLKIAEKEKNKKVVHFSIGFETTTAPMSVILKKAEEMGLENFKIYPSNKMTPPVVETLIKRYGKIIDGLITPGHVSAIIGVKGWEKITKKFGIPQVISGFESIDVLDSILLLLKMIKRNEASIVNQYNRVVKNEGNLKALDNIYCVFKRTSSVWRGFGKIENSGFVPKNRFKSVLVDKNDLEIEKYEKRKSISLCKCEKILCGLALPKDCPYFGKLCNPENPIGPCMVSREGACYINYMFGA